MKFYLLIIIFNYEKKFYQKINNYLQNNDFFHLKFIKVLFV